MATKDKKTSILDIKYIYFFGGILICLLSIILIINVGYFARALAFVPFFGFGVASCALYFSAYLIGLYILFKDKVFKFTSKSLIPGFLIAFIGLLIFASFHFNPTVLFEDPSISGPVTLTLKSTNEAENIWNFSDAFIRIMNNTDYFNASFLHSFTNSQFGGGYIGFLLVALINDYAKGMNDLIGVGLMIIGAIIMITPYVFRWVKKYKENQKTKPAAKEGIKKETTKVVTPIVNIKPQTPTPVVEQTPIKQEIPEPIVITTHSLYEDDFGATGTFVPAHFSFATRSTEIGTMNPIGSPISRPAFVESEVIKERDPEIIPETPVQEVIEESHGSEQMTLDFDACSQISEEEQKLGTVLPSFQEPTVVEERVVPAAAPVNPAAEPVKKKRVKFIPPDVSLLNEYEIADALEQNTATAESRKQLINSVFEEFKIGAEITGYTIGPAVTRFHVTYKPGVLVRSIDNIVNNLCVSLGGVDVIFNRMVPGECYSGLEVPNAVITTVGFKEVFTQLLEHSKDPMDIPFGKNISGITKFGSVSEFPHMLVSGTTGSGKSVFVQTIILSLLMRNSPDDLKFILVDPKQVEMSQYAEMPHLLCPIIYDPSEAKVAFEKLCVDMDERYAKLNSLHVKNIKDYNKKCDALGLEKIPTIVAIIDEYADLVEQCKDIVPHVIRIGQKARACGIHLIVCTQRPSTNVVTGSLKTNLPTHIALKANNSTDSVTILNEGGAEKLLGKGDMLVQSTVFAGQGLIRIQSPYARDDEIERIVTYLKDNYQVDYDPRFLDLVDHAKEASKTSFTMGTFGGSRQAEDGEYVDPEEELYIAVKDWTTTQDFVSQNKIKLQFGLGYPRSCRIFKRLQDEGIVEDNNNPTSAKGCRVLVHDHGFGETWVDNPAMDETKYDDGEF